MALRRNAYTDKAISDFNKAIELNPEYPEVYIFLTSIYPLIGQSDKVMADRNKAMERFYWRAISYELKGQYEKACNDYRTACRLFGPKAAYYRTACRLFGPKAACGEFDMLEKKGFCQDQRWTYNLKSSMFIQ